MGGLDLRIIEEPSMERDRHGRKNDRMIARGLPMTPINRPTY